MAYRDGRTRREPVRSLHDVVLAHHADPAHSLRPAHLIWYSHGGYEAEPLALQELLIYQLAAEVQELLLRSPHRRYVAVARDLSIPRGKFDGREMVNRGGITQAALPWAFHTRLEDNLINRVLLGGLRLGISLIDDLPLRTRLRRVVRVIQEDVSERELSREALRRV